MRKKRIALLLAGVMAASVLTGCSSQENGAGTGDTIRIGVFEPTSGDYAAGGKAELEGIELANELYPEVLGKKIELVKLDNKSDKKAAAKAVDTLIDQNVSAIIGSWGSSMCLAATKNVRDGKVPTVTAASTNPNITLNNDYYFRVCYVEQFQGKVLAQYANDKLGAKKVAVMMESNNDYSTGLTKFFSEPFKKLTGDPQSITTIVRYETGDRDFSTQLEDVRATNPDIIFVPGNYTESALIIKQAREMGIQTQFLGGDTWEIEDFLTTGGPAVEGALMCTSFDFNNPVTEEGVKFVDAYKAKYPGKEPAAVTALAYDAYLVILDAITRADSAKPADVRDALATTTDFEGATGMITIDREGNPEKDAIIKVVKNGKFVFQDAVLN